MSPKDTALSTIIGFISVLITYIGVAFFCDGITDAVSGIRFKS